jgi:hypothetical protein
LQAVLWGNDESQEDMHSDATAAADLADQDQSVNS